MSIASIGYLHKTKIIPHDRAIDFPNWLHPSRKARLLHLLKSKTTSHTETPKYISANKCEEHCSAIKPGLSTKLICRLYRYTDQWSLNVEMKRLEFSTVVYQRLSF